MENDWGNAPWSAKGQTNIKKLPDGYLEKINSMHKATGQNERLILWSTYVTHSLNCMSSLWKGTVSHSPLKVSDLFILEWANLLNYLRSQSSYEYVIRVIENDQWQWSSRLTWCIGWSFQVTVWTAVHWTLHKIGWFVHVLGREETRWNHVDVKCIK